MSTKEERILKLVDMKQEVENLLTRHSNLCKQVSEIATEKIEIQKKLDNTKHQIKLEELRAKLEQETGIEDHPKADQIWEKVILRTHYFKEAEAEYKCWVELLKP